MAKKHVDSGLSWLLLFLELCFITIIMNLKNQTIEKTRLILDKPSTPLTFKQITDLVNKRTAPVQQLTLLFVNKHRADLIIFVLKNFTLTVESHEVIVASACKNILKYTLQDLKSIWKLILETEAAKLMREKWGIQKPMRDGFLITNEAQKEMLFQLLASNVSVLLELNEVRIVENFVRKYAANFIKYNIYLAPVPAIASQCLLINSKAQIKLIDNPLKKSMLQRVLFLLNTTHERKIYTYQNNCLALIGLLMREPGECFVDLLDIYECQRVLELYLWNKPTREQARKMQQAVEVVRQRIAREEKDKMDYRSQVRQKQTKVPLIENVIDKAISYQQKQNIGILRQKQDFSPSRTKGSSFLKKGLGNGGGKAQISSFKSPPKQSKLSSIDQIVQSCFTQNQQESFFTPSKLNNNRAKSSLNSRISNHNKKIKSQSEAETVSVYSSSIQEGEQWTEISNLIDLAYQYKFG